MSESRLASLDHSESQRKRMLEVVKLFEERDTIDDLGLGSVRDVFSDLLFPGTSVLMTRARYLLFVPWTFQQLDDDRVRSADGSRRAREMEVRLIYALLEGGETDGVIGGQARETLKQLPSTAYWSALGNFGIRTTSATRTQVLDGLDRRRTQRRVVLTDDDGEVTDRVAGPWHPALPSRPEGLFDSATFTLSAPEAEYLRDRLRTATPGSALAFLLSQPRSSSESLWDHPALPLAPARLREVLLHAEMFAEVIHGAPLHYNRLLAVASQELRPDAGKLVEEYDEALDAWAARLDALGGRLSSWAADVTHFWQVVDDASGRVPDDTVRFVKWWFTVALPDNRRVRLHEQAVADRIRSRELSMKRARARLSNKRQLERWSGAIGTGRLEFRWPTVRRIVDDVLAGVEGVQDA